MLIIEIFIKRSLKKEEWWMISKGGESLQTGVDDTEIADGEAYEFTLTAGW